MEDVLARIIEMYRPVPRPAPESAPTEHPSLAKVFAKDVSTLTRRELCHVVGWIAPGLHDQLDALRFYLPTLMGAYADGTLPCEEELQCRLLQYRPSFLPEERQLLTAVALSRWKSHAPGSLYVQESAFLLFWCDDLTPLRKTFLRATAPPSETNSPEDFHLRLLSEVRQEVLTADDPLSCLWGHLYFPLDQKLYERIVSAKGTDILAFLREVQWLQQCPD